MKKILLALAAVVAVAAVGLGSWIAFADDESVVRGTCGTASYELGVEDEDGGTEVTFELQSTAPGETWDVVVTQDGAPILQGSRQTDEDAELDLDVPASDGGEEYAVTATLAGAEACTASLTR